MSMSRLRNGRRVLRFTGPVLSIRVKTSFSSLSDEHVFNLEGGRATKSGAPARVSGGYTLNPTGQPHSAMIATETISLVIYRGEPDEIRSIEVVDFEPACGARS